MNTTQSIPPKTDYSDQKIIPSIIRTQHATVVKSNQKNQRTDGNYKNTLEYRNKKTADHTKSFEKTESKLGSAIDNLHSTEEQLANLEIISDKIHNVTDSTKQLFKDIEHAEASLSKILKNTHQQKANHTRYYCIYAVISFTLSIVFLLLGIFVKDVYFSYCVIKFTTCILSSSIYYNNYSSMQSIIKLVKETKLQLQDMYKSMENSLQEINQQEEFNQHLQLETRYRIMRINKFIDLLNPN